MSKTIKEYKGTKYRERNGKWKVNFRRGEKKFFGWTDGSHSRGILDPVRDENGRRIGYVKNNRPPIKGKDFVKSGWPFETRHKSVIKDLAVTREMDAELKEY